MQSSAESNYQDISGTLYGNYDYSFEGNGAWVGHAVLEIADRPSLQATFVDRNTSLDRKPDGKICGTETITFCLVDGTFEVCAKFTGIPQSTPQLYTLHETGWIANGTGAYQAFSGHVIVEGPFLLPDPSSTAGAPPWIAELHGVIRRRS